MWLDHIMRNKVFEPCENRQGRDAYGSDNRLFCEPLCRTSLARTEVRKYQKCSNVDCDVARRTAIYKTVRLPGLLSGKRSLHTAANEFFGSSRAGCKAKAGHTCCNGVVETSTDIIHQSPFLVIPGDYVKYMNLKDIPREVSVPSKLTYDRTLQCKLMMININSGRDHFLDFSE